VVKRSTTALFLLLTAAALPSPALAAGDASTVASGAPDRGFLSEAARDGEAEVELGRMAAERASSPEVKQFAERMVRDHEAANQKLMALAREPKVKAPPPPDEEAQARMRELRDASGAAFDRAYMRYMIEDHAKAVALFQREAKDGEDAATRELADALLPTLQEHLRMARQIGSRVGVRG
jgi:putative membrane protein